MLGVFACAKISRAQDLGIPVIEGGLPHSEIRGSKFVRNSPRLIAAYHVLHRLSAPRHSPDALQALDCSHRRCPPLGRGFSRENDLSFRRKRNRRLLHFSFREKTSLLRKSSGDVGVGRTASETRATNGIRPDCSEGECPDDLPLHDVIERKFPSRLRRGIGTSSNGRIRRSRDPVATPSSAKMVEPDGIEPTTSCLQSRRSPN